MKVTPAAAAVSLLLLLLTWLSTRAIDTDAELFDRALAALDQFAILETTLNRDVLSARAGLLRNYDPLVREANALRETLDRLREAAAVDAVTAVAIDRLAASVGQQEAFVEQFKSNNAVLQNSLAYFELYSVRFGASDNDGPLVPAVSGGAVIPHWLDPTAASVCSVAAMENTTPRPGSAHRQRGVAADRKQHYRQRARSLVLGPIQACLGAALQISLPPALSSAAGRRAIAQLLEPPWYGPACPMV
jgi:hypothetical protein